MELLVLLLKFLIEFALEFVAEALTDGISRFFKRKGEPFDSFFSLLYYAFIGSAFGLISLAFFPIHFISDPELRIWNLLLSPILLGVAMGAWGKYLLRKGKRVTGVDSYVMGFVLALCFAMVRHFGAK